MNKILSTLGIVSIIILPAAKAGCPTPSEVDEYLKKNSDLELNENDIIDISPTGEWKVEDITRTFKTSYGQFHLSENGTKCIYMVAYNPAATLTIKKEYL